MMRTFSILVKLILVVAILQASDRVEGATVIPVDTKAIMTWEFSKGREPMAAMEEALKGASKKQMHQVEAKLITVLQTPQATYAGKQYVCRMLRKIGSQQCVPALAKLLKDTKLAHMARFALQHNSSAQAAAALRAELGQTRDDNLKIGLIGSLGARGDREAVSQIAPYLTSKNKALAQAAVRALGVIGGSQAAGLLTKAQVCQSLKPLQADSILLCADSLAEQSKGAQAAKIYSDLAAAGNPAMVRVAANGGLIRTNPAQACKVISTMLKDRNQKVRRAGGKFARELPTGLNVTMEMTLILTDLEPEGKIMLLSTLADRGDRGASGVVTRMVSNAHEGVRVEAIRTLGVLGNAKHVSMLAGLSVRKDNTGRAAFESLKRLTGTGVSLALEKMVGNYPDPAQRAQAVEAIRVRRETRSLPILLRAAKDRDGGVRKAAVKALGEMGGPRELSVLVEMLVSTAKTSDLDSLTGALQSIVGRFPAEGSARNHAETLILKSLPKAGDQAKASLISMLPLLGSSKALAASRGQLTGSSDVKKAAIRALSAWPNAKPMADLLRLAKSESDMASHVLALRGFIQLTGKLSPDQAKSQKELFTSAMEIARRVDEKKQILGALAKVAAPWSLELAKKYQSDPALETEATAAYKKISAAIK